MPNLNGFILGLILTIIVLNILGLRWVPLFGGGRHNKRLSLSNLALVDSVSY